MTDPDPEYYHARLLARKTELSDINDAAASSRETVDLDQTAVGRLSRMDALQGQAMSQEIERRRLAELHRIDVALRRVEDDEYGWCITCGEAIESGRLDLDASVAQCTSCASGKG